MPALLLVGVELTHTWEEVGVNGYDLRIGLWRLLRRMTRCRLSGERVIVTGMIKRCQNKDNPRLFSEGYCFNKIINIFQCLNVVWRYLKIVNGTGVSMNVWQSDKVGDLPQRTGFISVCGNLYFHMHRQAR